MTDIELKSVNYLKTIREYRLTAKYARQMADYYREQIRAMLPYRHDMTLQQQLEDQAEKAERKAEWAESQAGQRIALIETVPDVQERQLLMHKYVDLMAWPEVAVSLGLNYNRFYTLRKRALEKFAIEHLQEDHDEGTG